MKHDFVTAGILALVLATPGLAASAQSKDQARQDAQAQAKLDHDATKAQAKADKKAEKALKSDKVKDAAKAQDKADAKAAKANLK